MKLYSINDLNQGSGLFDHLMRTGREHPSNHANMPREVAIGVVAAATASGLRRSEIAEVIHGYFGERDASLLDATFDMYAGKDERI